MASTPTKSGGSITGLVLSLIALATSGVAYGLLQVNYRATPTADKVGDAIATGSVNIFSKVIGIPMGVIGIFLGIIAIVLVAIRIGMSGRNGLALNLSSMVAGAAAIAVAWLAFGPIHIHFGH